MLGFSPGAAAGGGGREKQMSLSNPYALQSASRGASWDRHLAEVAGTQLLGEETKDAPGRRLLRRPLKRKKSRLGTNFAMWDCNLVSGRVGPKKRRRRSRQCMQMD